MLEFDGVTPQLLGPIAAIFCAVLLLSIAGVNVSKDEPGLKLPRFAHVIAIGAILLWASTTLLWLLGAPQ